MSNIHHWNKCCNIFITLSHDQFISLNKGDKLLELYSPEYLVEKEDHFNMPDMLIKQGNVLFCFKVYVENTDARILNTIDLCDKLKPYNQNIISAVFSDNLGSYAVLSPFVHELTPQN